MVITIDILLDEKFPRSDEFLKAVEHHIKNRIEQELTAHISRYAQDLAEVKIHHTGQLAAIRVDTKPEKCIHPKGYTGIKTSTIPGSHPTMFCTNCGEEAPRTGVM